MRKQIIVVLTFLVVLAMTSCGGGTTTVVPNPNSTNPVIIIDNPAPANPAGTITLKFNTPSFWDGNPNNPPRIHVYETSVNLDAYRESSNLRTASELVNFDREIATETATAIAQRLWDDMLTGVDDDFITGGTWNGWGFDSDDTVIAREVQGMIWYGLTCYVELYDTALATLIKAELVDQMAPNGYLYDLYTFCVVTSGDDDSGTTEDRMLGIEIALYSKLANVLNTPSFDLMAQAAMQEISDERSGSQMFNDLLSLDSLSLWNAAFYIRAASLTYHDTWAEGMIDEMDGTRTSWEGQPYNGDDYTDLGWSALAGAIAQLDEYYILSTMAQNYWDEATVRIFATTDAHNGYGSGTDYFRHRSYGYLGFVESGLLWDSSQFTANGLWSLADCDKFVGNGSNQQILGAADGMLEWWIQNILPFSTGVGLDGVIFPNYRGPISIGAPYSPQLCGETLSAIVLSAEQFRRYPNIPNE